MQKSDLFLIESDRSGNRLSLNGRSIARFVTLDAAEAEANKVANRAVPGASLRFELDFKWTLTDLEIRAATLERASGAATHDHNGFNRARLRDTANVQRYSAWHRHERWLVAALNDWRQAIDAMPWSVL
jgi:hypothetical protein